MYIGPEFQLGQVYDGTMETGETVVLYRPVYICVSNPKLKEIAQGRRLGSEGKACSSGHLAVVKNKANDNITGTPTTSSTLTTTPPLSSLLSTKRSSMDRLVNV